MIGSALRRWHLNRAAKQAAEWHVEMLEPESAAQVAAFEAWLAASPEHARAYAEVDALSAQVATLPRRVVAMPPKNRSHEFLRPALGVAAAVLLIAASAFLLTGGGRQAAVAAIVNQGPGVRDYRLADGTRLMLDPGSRLGVSLDANERRVTLQAGRARIDVARADRPMEIRVADAIVRAEMAVVDVAIDRQRAEVTVLKGEAQLSPADQSVARRAVAEGTVATLAAHRVITRPLVAAATRWPDARVAFDNASLESVIARANQAGGPPLVLASPALGSRRVTGVLDLRDRRALARKLAATLDLRIVDTGRTILLSLPNPK